MLFLVFPQQEEYRDLENLSGLICHGKSGSHGSSVHAPYPRLDISKNVALTSVAIVTQNFLSLQLHVLLRYFFNLTGYQHLMYLFAQLEIIGHKLQQNSGFFDTQVQLLNFLHGALTETALPMAQFALILQSQTCLKHELPQNNHGSQK